MTKKSTASNNACFRTVCDTFSELVDGGYDHAAHGLFVDLTERLAMTHEPKPWIEQPTEGLTGYDALLMTAKTLLRLADKVPAVVNGVKRTIASDVRMSLNDLLTSEPRHRPHWAAEFSDFLSAVK
jgi:hypothetical protein